MKRLTKKLIIPLVAVSTLPTLALVSCGRNDSENSTVSRLSLSSDVKDNQTITIRQKAYTASSNSVYTPVAFLTTGVNGFGVLDSDASSKKLKPLEVRVFSSPTFETKVVRGENNTFTRSVKRSSFGTFAYKLGSAKKFIVTVFEDGQKVDKVFDKDDYNAYNSARDDEREQQGYVHLLSDDVRSVNSPEFEKALKNAVHLKIQVNTDISYVDNKGEIAKDKNGNAYKLQAKDFFLGYQHTFLDVNTTYRYRNGGSSALDKAIFGTFNTATAGSINSFNEHLSNDVNRYLWDLYNIDANKILDEESFLTTDSDGNQYLNLYEKDSEENATSKKDATDFLTFFQYLNQSYDFQPIPTKYIEDHSSDEKLFTPLTADKYQAFKSEYDKLSKDSLVYKTGQYWYGYEPRNTLFLGQYLPEGFDSTSNQYITIKNKNYYDQSWVNNPQTFNYFVVKYQNNPLDPQVYSDNSYNELTAGYLSSTSWHSLQSNQQSNILRNLDRYNLSYLLNYNPLTLVTTTWWNLNPTKFSNDSSGVNPWANETASKLLYNVTNAEVKGGDAVNLVKNSTSNYSNSFRSILQASVNWNEWVNTAWNTASLPWIATYGMDARLDGKDADLQHPKTVRNEYYKNNSIFVVDKDGNKVTFTNLPQNRKGFSEDNTYLGPLDSIQFSLTTDQRLKSVVFDQLKGEMKKLLDAFFQDNPTLEQKVKITIPEPRAWTALVKNRIPDLKKVLNELDPRLDISWTEVPNPQYVSNWYSNPNSLAEHIGWTYDYDGVTSGLNGFTTSRLGVDSMLFNLVADDQYKTRMQKSFPMLVKVSEDFLKYLTDNKIVFRVKKDKNYEQKSLNEARAKEGFDDLFLETSDTVTHKQVLTEYLKLPQKYLGIARDYLVKPSAKSPDLTFEVLSSLFWLSEGRTLTMEELTKLGVELTTLLGTIPAFALFPVAQRFTAPESGLPTEFAFVPNLYGRGVENATFKNGWSIKGNNADFLIKKEALK
ncbi:OppA family ABC transporter substrate-binding lipoprotein [Mycoplasmopsis synoviae]|uniref:OppA family ABC transporter substrate-binding lipoprotein n=1 Tax=Mycoplasmopsis synoviae TaxID=2109 RepID=UPI001CE03A02|nr:hypothetical protein [Mycoplasmopsis synoviae]UBX97317.1 hypothetical protein K6989_02955 [Mycoplasmopsis synoviae]UBX98006.1 hypothetical protein K6987_03180 [Mycoplasmopsis synoviae]UBX98942.1 hypothetical protein K6986_01130 [Mycoplasmopsis synoviae]UBX99298.1 hypothetical protein K6988_03200 [Mycoplasmopsis synoviae]UBY00238.1 hypothetical protein K6990_01215 [Mycoplasmopsis synoviae]